MTDTAHEVADGVVLVLAAFEPELATMRGALDRQGSVTGGVPVALHAIGIGLSAAAAGAALRLCEHRPRLAILVGTCGAYAGSGLSVGDCVVARRVHLVEPCALPELGGLMQLPTPPMRVAFDTDRATSAGLQSVGAAAGDLATTLGVTVDDRAADAIARATGAHVEHMEAHGVGAACEAVGVPFAAVLGVANVVGSGAREQWRTHHREAAAAANRLVLEWVARGSPGIPER